MNGRLTPAPDTFGHHAWVRAACIGAPILVGTALATAAGLNAADLPKRAEPAPSETLSYVDWSGPYAGAEASAGALFGKFFFEPASIGGERVPSFSTDNGSRRTGTPVVAGAYGGFNRQVDRIVFGVEGDLAATTLKQSIGSDRAAGFGFADVDPAFDLFRTKTDRIGSVRARLGVAFDRFLLYVTGGPAFAATHIFADYPGLVPGLAWHRSEVTHFGYTAGAGFEVAVSEHFALGIEYRISQFGGRTYALGALLDTGAPAFGRVDFTTHQTMARLSWFPTGLMLPKEDSEDTTASGAPEVKNWSIHGQATLFQQGVNRFRSPYIGPNSLIPHQARETWTTTAFLGTRLWDGAELYFNPELDQGFGLSRTLGVGGYVNGEAQKAGAIYPKFRPQRYFLRQTIGLGGEQEVVKDGANQMAGTRDIDRITITAGKFAVGDFFDDNAYAHDPRANFMNWSLWASAAYDFPANLPGFTQGVVAELNRKDWALRAGFFQVPKQPNSDVLDPRILKKGGAVVELEERHTLFDQPGKLRLGFFANKGRTANYDQVLTLSKTVPDFADPNDAVAATRRDRTKVGLYANLEQAVTESIGIFARASANDGRNEILSFTDIDRSVSGGVSVKGKSWGRPEDTFGVGGAINGLSAPHRDFLAAGGLGLLIGDGRLNYRPEKILEAYYSVSLAKPVILSLDYQFITNPAYNADRGPASFFGARLHAEF